jgi:hypothetical protein
MNGRSPPGTPPPGGQASVRAAKLRGHGDRLRAETGYALSISSVETRERAVAATRVAVGDDAAFERALAAGAAMSTEEALALAFATPNPPPS